MSDFADRMQALVAVELQQARHDPDRMGEVIERLINSLAFVVAIATRGDPKGIDTMLEGASARLYEMATEHAKVGKFMASIPPAGLPPSLRRPFP